jgi:hypothetical protein
MTFFHNIKDIALEAMKYWSTDYVNDRWAVYILKSNAPRFLRSIMGACLKDYCQSDRFRRAFMFESNSAIASGRNFEWIFQDQEKKINGFWLDDWLSSSPNRNAFYNEAEKSQHKEDGAIKVLWYAQMLERKQIFEIVEHGLYSALRDYEISFSIGLKNPDLEHHKGS